MQTIAGSNKRFIFMWCIISQTPIMQNAANLPRRNQARTRRGCFGGMRSDGEKDGSDPILTRRHFAERLDGTGKM
jgi:hypothetical protein